MAGSAGRIGRGYPQFASDLVDLSRELNRGFSQNEAPLSANEKAMIARSPVTLRTSGHQNSASRNPVRALLSLIVRVLFATLVWGELH